MRNALARSLWGVCVSVCVCVCVALNSQRRGCLLSAAIEHLYHPPHCNCLLAYFLEQASLELTKRGPQTGSAGKRA